MGPREEGGRLIYPCANCYGYGVVQLEDAPFYEERCLECDGTGEYVDEEDSGS